MTSPSSGRARRGRPRRCGYCGSGRGAGHPARRCDVPSRQVLRGRDRREVFDLLDALGIPEAADRLRRCRGCDCAPRPVGRSTARAGARTGSSPARSSTRRWPTPRWPGARSCATTASGRWRWRRTGSFSTVHRGARRLGADGANSVVRRLLGAAPAPPTVDGGGDPRLRARPSTDPRRAGDRVRAGPLPGVCVVVPRRGWWLKCRLRCVRPSRQRQPDREFLDALHTPAARVRNPDPATVRGHHLPLSTSPPVPS